MKKVLKFQVWAILLALCVGISSCSKDDEDDLLTGVDSKVFGKWQLAGVEGLELTEEDLAGCDFKGWIEIKKDGAIVSYDACEGETYSAKWSSVSSNVIKIIEGSDESIVTIISVSDKELVLKVDDEPEVYKYKRIN